MDTERLGLSPEQQAQIDTVYVNTTLDALTRQSYYMERAALVTEGDVADELEGIHARAYDQAHIAIIERGPISPVVTDLIGKLAFIDSLCLPSSQVLDRRDKTARALGYYANRRRLFRGLPHTESQA